MKFFLDVNICLDYLVPERVRHIPVKEALDSLRGNQFFLASYSYDTLLYILVKYLKSEKIAKEKLETFFQDFSVKTTSTTGRSILNSKSYKDVEDGILTETTKRISNESIILTYDKYLLQNKEIKSLTPEDAVKSLPIFNTQKSIPLLDLQKEYYYLMEDLYDAILKCVAGAKYILGPQVKQLEDKVAEYLGIKHCIGVSSGTDALVLSLRALAIKLRREEYWNRDDLIITTPFTFTATGDAILRAGATPLFVDIDPQTYNIDPNKIKSYLTTQQSDHSTKVIGIIPVHLYGQSCQMDEIMKIAEEYGLFVVEDVAQAFGGVWNGSAGSPQRLGSMGTTGCFSFFPSKPMGGYGDGGMVATSDDEIAELMRMLLRHGGKDKYNVDHIGYNARLDTLQAAILLAKFKYIDEFNERRRKIAEIYNRELKGLEDLVLPLALNPLPFADSGHVYHQYTIRVHKQDKPNIPDQPDKLKKQDGPDKLNRRDKLQAYLKEKGISAMVYYPFPLHKMKVFEGKSKMWDRLDGAEQATQSVLSLPIEPLQAEADTAYIIDCLKGHFLH